MAAYKTAEVASVVGLHPNTVRFYEEWELIPKPKRQPNGYRVFTDFHIEQFRLARLAFQVEVLQSGLRKKMDTLRNWEMNGLLTVKRKENGYRVYTDDDIRRLKIIRSHRCANYSLEAILQMLCQLSKNPNVDILEALNTPKENADIIAVCDQLITSIFDAESNAQKMIAMLEEMKLKF